MSEPKTDAQRAAAHVWFRQAAEVLNEAGIERRVVVDALVERGVEVQWDGDSFKADVYKPVFQKVTREESTEDANRTDHNICYEGLCKWFAQEFGVVLPPWPTREQSNAKPA